MMGLKTVVAAIAVVAGCLGGGTAIAATHHGSAAHTSGHGSVRADGPRGAKLVRARPAAVHASAKAGHHTGNSAKVGHRVVAGAKPTAAIAHAKHGPKASVGAARDAKGKFARSPQAKTAFKKGHPCPSTGRASGACPGFVIDHVVPLKRGGADKPSNMQWQTTTAAKAKDKRE